MLVQNPHFAHFGEETVNRFDYVACFHGLSGNIFQNGSYRVTFLRVDGDFCAVAGAAHFGNAATLYCAKPSIV